MRTYRPDYKVNGVVHTSRRWWIDLHDHRGVRRRLAGLADRRATEAIGRNIERLVRYVATGDPPDPALARWLAICQPNSNGPWPTSACWIERRSPVASRWSSTSTARPTYRVFTNRW